MAENTLYYTYLPMLRRDNPPFTGRVTDNGTPVSGQELSIYYSQTGGRTYEGFSKTTSTVDGKFVFTTTPDVNISGQQFYVLWSNIINNTAWLYLFQCSEVSLENKDYSCDINVHGIPLTAPPDEAHIKTPAVFSWRMRPEPTDNYIFGMFDDVTFDTIGYLELGYTDSQVIEFPASLFKTNYRYDWRIDVETPDGFGMSYDLRQVYFNNVTP